MREFKKIDCPHELRNGNWKHSGNSFRAMQILDDAWQEREFWSELESENHFQYSTQYLAACNQLGDLMQQFYGGARNET